MSNQTIPATEANRRRIGRGISFAIIFASVVVAGIAVWVYDYRPQTDDASIRANFIGIAPHASGHIVELRVKDKQFVKEGDVLFVIDPRPYEHAVATAKAQLVLAHKQVDGAEKALQAADASIARAEAQRAAAEATVHRAEADFKNSDDHLKRLEPLLAKDFTTTDQVEAARTKQLIAADAVEQAQKNLIAAIPAVGHAKAEQLRTEDAIAQQSNINGQL